MLLLMGEPCTGSAAAKPSLRNGSRVVPPERTWSRIKSILPEFGITRVGDITGLDRIGIPVWIAVRPNARTLSVSQGKGPDDISAKVSAAMESLEIAHAEQPGLRVEYASLGEIAARGDVVDVDSLPRMRGSVFGLSAAIPWTLAADWKTGAAVWVPYELVHADATVPRMRGAGVFIHSTNGLASGNIRAEAMLHGLCEVIERDALALFEQAAPEMQAARRLDLTTIDDPIATRLIERLAAAEIVPIAWDATSDIGIATVRVALHDETSDPVTRPLPASLGAGCHPDRRVAFCRAVTEAAQGRLTGIAGSRDDIGRSRYRDSQSAVALAGYRQAAHDESGERPFGGVPTHTCDSVTADLERVLAQLARAGLERVIFVDLGRPGMPVSVVRVIVPGLEGPIDSPSYVPGRRARARLAREAAR
jgi:ribosomal protein S12 methylthiotransferase accessory factor